MYLLCRVHGKNFALSEISCQKLSNTLLFKHVDSWKDLFSFYKLTFSTMFKTKEKLSIHNNGINVNGTAGIFWLLLM